MVVSVLQEILIILWDIVYCLKTEYDKVQCYIYMTTKITQSYGQEAKKEIKSQEVITKKVEKEKKE